MNTNRMKKFHILAGVHPTYSALVEAGSASEVEQTLQILGWHPRHILVRETTLIGLDDIPTRAEWLARVEAKKGLTKKALGVRG